MTPEDAAKVLLLASVYDNRQFDEITAAAWADALHGLQLGDCLDAVKMHFSRTKEWLMPADVRAWANSIAEDRHRRRQAQAAIEAPAVALPEPEVIHQRIDELREAIAQVGRMPTDEPSPHPSIESHQVRTARKHSCPWCKAPVGSTCVNSATGRPTDVIHEKRLIAAGLATETKITITETASA